MKANLSAAERAVALLVAVLGVAAIAGPHIGAPANYHDFADARGWHGLPHAGDVLSNIAFLAAGLAGLITMRRTAAPLAGVQRAMSLLFFGGLVLTAACSTWYHLGPDEARLVVDRAGMAFAFAGLIGLAAATQVSERAAPALALAVLFAAPWAVHTAAQGDLLAWGVLQFGGMALLIAMAAMRSRPGALQVHWLAVIGIYALAKACEAGDAAIFAATHHLVSGHSLKHFVAAFAAAPVIAALHWHNRPAAAHVDPVFES